MVDGPTPELPPSNKEAPRNPQEILDIQDRKINLSYKEAFETLVDKGLEREMVLGWKDIEGIETDNGRIARMAQLIVKYDEYSQRLRSDPTMTMPPAGRDQIDSWLKREIVRRIIMDGQVNLAALSTAIDKTNGNKEGIMFAKACVVIEGYIRNGGKNITGGTGLRQPQPKST